MDNNYIGGYEVFDDNHELGRINVWMTNDKGHWFESNNPLKIPSLLYHNIKMPIIERMKHNGDMYICVDGAEGAGKTILATQIGSVMAAIASKRLRRKISFGLDNIVYSSEDCIRLNKELPDWTPILLDEAMQAGSSKMSMNQAVKRWEFFMSGARTHHKFNIIVLPRIFDLVNYLMIHRIKMLLHFEHKFGRNDSFGYGKFVIYGQRSVKLIGANVTVLKKTNQYPKSKGYPMQSYRWPTVNQGIMDAMKRKMLDDTTKDNVILNEGAIVKSFITSRLLELKGVGYTGQQLAEIFGISYATVYNYLKIAKEGDATTE